MQTGAIIKTLWISSIGGSRFPGGTWKHSRRYLTSIKKNIAIPKTLFTTCFYKKNILGWIKAYYCINGSIRNSMWNVHANLLVMKAVHRCWARGVTVTSWCWNHSRKLKLRNSTWAWNWLRKRLWNRRRLGPAECRREVRRANKDTHSSEQNNTSMATGFKKKKENMKYETLNSSSREHIRVNGKPRKTDFSELWAPLDKEVFEVSYLDIFVLIICKFIFILCLFSNNWVYESSIKNKLLKQVQQARLYNSSDYNDLNEWKSLQSSNEFLFVCGKTKWKNSFKIFITQYLLYLQPEHLFIQILKTLFIPMGQ